MKQLLLTVCIATLAFACKNKKTGWAPAEKSAFTNQCIEAAVDKGMGRDTATSYCNCMQQKLEKKYAKAEDAGNLDMNTMQEMAKECLNIK